MRAAIIIHPLLLVGGQIERKRLVAQPLPLRIDLIGGNASFEKNEPRILAMRLLIIRQLATSFAFDLGVRHLGL